MITKVVTNSFDFGEIATQLVPLHSRGVDSQWMHKHASAGIFNDFISSMKPRRGQTVIHVIALGDEERWGPNRNGDGFSREDNRTAHQSFKDVGHVFRNHQNQDPFKAVGEVLATAHNENMSRVQLLLGLDDDKCRREVQALDNGQDCPVSMGCFTAGHLLTLEDGSTIPLEQAVKGQHVITHMGRRLPITHVFDQAPYSGTLYSISAKTVPDIEATAEHPFFVVRQERLIHPGRKTRRVDPEKLGHLDVSRDGKWVAAQDLRVGDYLVTPVNIEEELPDYMSLPLARLLGYYAAEGHVRLTPACNRYCSVQFSLNKADEAVSEIPRLCEELGIDQSCVQFHEASHSEHYIAITVTDSELAYRCATLCGMHAKKKRLSSELMLLPFDYQKAFLGALINGDGCAGSGAQTGALYISTASPFYRDQLRLLLARVGVTPGMNTISHHAGKGKNTYNTTEYQVYIPRTDAPVLAEYTVKSVRDVLTSRRGGRRLRVGDYILTPIDSIACREVVDEPIYNVEVQPDNSYLINGVAVHNSQQAFDECSICKHRAPTALDHCHHIKTMLGQLLDDGRKVYMKNPNPKYFDISLVFKPADRIAYTLKKVASAGGVIGGHDLAELYGLRPVTSPKYAALRSLASIYKEVPLTLRRATAPQDLPEDTVAELKKQARVHGIDHLLAFLHANNWLVSPRDFGDVIGHEDPEGCDRAVQDFSDLEELLDDHTEIQALGVPSLVDHIPFSPMAREDLDQNCSMLPEPTNARVIRISLTKQAASRPSLEECEARGFASLYSHYKLAFAAEHQSSAAVLRSVAATF